MNDTSQDDEYFYIVCEMPKTLPNSISCAEFDSSRPIIQINSSHYFGVREELPHTCILFEKDQNSVKHVGNATQGLEFRKVVAVKSQGKNRSSNSFLRGTAQEEAEQNRLDGQERKKIDRKSVV